MINQPKSVLCSALYSMDSPEEFLELMQVMAKHAIDTAINTDDDNVLLEGWWVDVFMGLKQECYNATKRLNDVVIKQAANARRLS